jgi:hypothetical protein
MRTAFVHPDTPPLHAGTFFTRPLPLHQQRHGIPMAGAKLVHAMHQQEKSIRI